MAKPWDRACATRGSGHMSLKTAVSLSVVVAPLTSQAWILSPVIPQHDHSRRGTRWAQCVGLPTRVLPTLAPSLPATTSEGRRSMACRSSTIGGSTTGFKPMQEGDEVELPFDEDDFDDAEEDYALDPLEDGDGEYDGEEDMLTSPEQVIGVEQAMERVRELKALGPPRPVKGQLTRSKRRYPVVAVIGRPNVGKSTVVNRLARQFSAGSIVYDEPGVTRDRTYKRAWYCGKDYDIVDTGGLVFDDKGGDVFAKEIRQQALIALEEASAVIFVVDGQSGCHALDMEIARFLRQQKVPVIVAVNKCESEVYDMMDEVVEHLHEVEPEANMDESINIAIVGRPNVGKSSLLNKLFGETRSIVSEIPGTTRDSIDAMFERGGRYYRLVDTAGIRRKGKVDYGNEFFMVNRAFKAIRRADIVFLLVDVEAGITDQDRVLADRVQADGRACIVVCNKWDLVQNKDDKVYKKAVEYAREMLSPVKWAEVIFTSAKTGQRCFKLFDIADEVVVQHRRRIKTSVLNEVLRDAVLWQAPPTRKKTAGSAQGKIYFCNQVASCPPTVAIFCNNPKLFSDNYKRYLDRKFREQATLPGKWSQELLDSPSKFPLGLKSTPIRFLWRGKKLRRLQQENRRSPKPYSDQ